MKSLAGFKSIAAIFILVAGFSSRAQNPPGGGAMVGGPSNDGLQDTLTTALSPEIKPIPVLAAMQRVADWQLAHPAKYKPTEWTQGAGYAGFMALAGISIDPKYRDAMLAVAESNEWQ